MVFTDLMMPVMDGYEAVGRFREWEADTKREPRQVVYAVSANACEQDQAMADRCVASDCFPDKWSILSIPCR